MCPRSWSEVPKNLVPMQHGNLHAGLGALPSHLEQQQQPFDADLRIQQARYGRINLGQPTQPNSGSSLLAGNKLQDRQGKTREVHYGL
jgi:hypothetical protein